ncbi:hypothetical protein DMNBHIDG_01077 [Candidatus Methanoperedenaceae archaeon GB37]|nr:hypothetical protein DMNBHIDG_01077 [Candidatus Methanoperedenaceae archaeon GB37]
MRRFKLALLYLVVLFFASSLSFAQFSYQATILKVSDGDTVWVLMDGRRVKLRLLGIDTPEKFKSKKLVQRCPGVWCLSGLHKKPGPGSHTLCQVVAA